MKRTALFSLNDTSRADCFAEQLIRAGWDIIGSRETVEALGKKGLPVRDIADFTGVGEDYGFPPTLHAKVEYALTANGSPRIDLVYVIPYSLSAGNDVGGRTLLALAVKGGRIAVMSVGDMERVAFAISETGDIPPSLRVELADKVCFEIALHYSSLVSNRERYDFLAGRFSYELLNGENPYQIPASAFISASPCIAASASIPGSASSISSGDDDPLSLLNFRQASGDAPCFTNMADADSILATMCLAAEAFAVNTGSAPYLCVAAKHGNACGMGVSKASPAEAVEKALFGNPRSIWGGEAIVNFPVDRQLAEVLSRSGRRERLLGNGAWMLDVVMAPSFTSEAISILGKRKERKLLANVALLSPSPKKSGFTYRAVRGGFLRQPPPTYILNRRACRIVGQDLSESDVSSLLVAWAVVFSSSHGGNEIAIAKDGALLSAGGGPSTVEAARVAVARAIDCGHETKGAVFGADAFFPFIDAPAVLCEAGITVGCVPAGGKNEKDIREFFCARGGTVAYIPPEFRGFCRH